MARPSRTSKSRTARAQAPAPKTAQALAENPAEPPPASEMPVGPPADSKPAVALVPDAPAAPKRRGRPPAKEKKAPRKARGKNARPDILFLVETGEETDQYSTESLHTVSELLDLMDENRKVLATRSWREF